MRKLLLLAATAAFGVSLCGTAMAGSIYGTVWLHTGEEAACANILVYDAEGCDYEDYVTGQATDECGYYDFDNLDPGTTYWFHIEFPIIHCTLGGYSGTCPYTEIECDSASIPGISQSREKDWDLGLPDCDNIGCE